MAYAGLFRSTSLLQVRWIDRVFTTESSKGTLCGSSGVR
jgi:hypothetical protein